MKRIISVFIAAVTALSLLTCALPAAADPFPFRDVPEDSWFYGPVRSVFEKGIMKGTSADRFSPDDSMTRGQIVTILARMSGEDYAGAAKNASFRDVPASEYYADPVGWAVKNGIAKGMSAAAFEPESPVLRQEFAAFFVRYMDHKGIKLPEEDAAPFPDKIPDWAKENVETLHRAGLVKGDAAGRFNPGDKMTRAEIATVTDRFLSMTPEDPMYAALESLDSMKCAAHNRIHYIAGLSAVEAERGDVSLSRIGAGFRDAMGLDPESYDVRVRLLNLPAFEEFHYDFPAAFSITVLMTRVSVRNTVTGETTGEKAVTVYLSIDNTRREDLVCVCPEEVNDEKLERVWNGLGSLYVFDDDGKVRVPYNNCRTEADLSDYFTRILLGLDDDHDLGQDNGAYKLSLAEGDFDRVSSLRGTGGETTVTATLVNRMLKKRSEPKELTLVVMNRQQCVDKLNALSDRLRDEMAILEGMIGDCRRAGIPTDYEDAALAVLAIFAEEHIPDYFGIEEFSRELYVRRSTDRVFEEARASLEALLAGEKDPVNVPKYVPGGMEVDGFTIRANTVDSYGNFENRPVYFYGYGDGGEYPRTYLPYYKELGSNAFHYYLITFADVVRAATPSDTVGVSADGKYVVDTSGMEADLAYLSDANEGEQSVSLMLIINAGFLPDIYPELGKVGAEEGGEVGFNLTHPKGREVVEAFLRAVVPIVSKFPCVDSFVLTNEPGYKPSEYGDYYVPMWAEFLSEKYGTVENLNGICGASYASFEDVPLAGREILKGRTVLSLDNQEFATKVHSDWHRWVAGIVHELAPDIEISTKLKSIEFDRAMQQYGLRPEDWSDFQDLGGCDDVRDDVMYYDHIAYSEEAPVVDSEIHIYHDSRDTAFTYDMDVWTERIVWRGIMHHLGVGNFWSDDYWSGHADHYSFGNSAYRPLTRYNVGKVTMDLNRLSYEIDALVSEEPDVAILYSYPSRALTVGDATETMNGAYLGLLECGKKVRVLSEEQIEKLEKEEIKLLVVPGSVNVSEKTLEAIDAFQARGGEVVVFGVDSLTRDGVNVPHSSSLPDKIKSAATVRGPMTSDDGYRRFFADYLKKNGMQRVWVEDAAAGEPVGYRTEWLSAEYGGKTLVTVYSLGTEEPVDVRISVDGTPVSSSRDLRTGTYYGETVTLVKNVALLLELDPPEQTKYPVPVDTAHGNEEGFEYAVSDGEATLIRYTGGGTEVVVPETLGGVPVTAVGGFAFTAAEPAVTSVVLPTSVSTLAARAFYRCPELRSVSIDGVGSIGDAAFFGCPKLGSVVIPEGVTEIGTRAFFRCQSLVSVSLPEGLKKIGNYAFRGCSSLSSLDLPSTLEKIGFAAFSGCSSISGTVTIPYGVTEILGDAFRFCSRIERVVVANSVINIGERAFEDDFSLKEIVLPNSLKKLGGNALTNDPLVRLDLPYGLSDLGSIHMFSPIYVPPTINFFPDYWEFHGGVECEAGSAYERLCAENGISYTIVAPEHHIHTPGAAPTCTAHQTCTECGAVLRPSYGHTLTAKRGEDGKAVYFCAECGEIQE
ncbi:MAG: leucine-rich repeat protein [Clostridia bacterium]|nr:leucine-rich repeat protein [Clostridia bacterium]